MPPHAHHHRRKIELTRRTLVGWIFAFIWLMALPAWAAEYHLEVTDLDYMTYAANLGTSRGLGEALGHVEILHRGGGRWT
jgi:hypothetical protein